ncbi:AAA family ATPase [Haloglomus halophilum]|uniref:AAA family ATPase n=1 Tax=Haloglomus halophilum TaxID=2962672 RepID=UPI0020C9A1B8|nr:MoxR family ATPase [Haloglomus halophilum]
MDVTEASDSCEAILSEVADGVVADERFLEDIMLGILARGNVLIEDVPGTGKTLTANLFATALGLSFSRVQFTPDLLPADVTGTHVYDEVEGSFEFREGPVFAQVVLGDEINRAPPKTQAALLEAMAEHQVTAEGTTHDLPEPFFVLATQNPVEQEGTFPLPEAQVDRFLVKTSLGYPERDAERRLLSRRLGRAEQVPTAEQVVDPEAVRALQSVPETVHVDEDLQGYMTDIARATREDPRVEVGVSPRGTQRLLESARAHAVLAGRDFATPDDVKRVARPVLAHRLVLTAKASVEDVDATTVVDDVLDDIAVPTVAEAGTGR